MKFLSIERKKLLFFDRQTNNCETKIIFQQPKCICRSFYATKIKGDKYKSVWNVAYFGRKRKTGEKTPRDCKNESIRIKERSHLVATMNKKTRKFPSIQCEYAFKYAAKEKPKTANRQNIPNRIQCTSEQPANQIKINSKQIGNK